VLLLCVVVVLADSVVVVGANVVTATCFSVVGMVVEIVAKGVVVRVTMLLIVVVSSVVVVSFTPSVVTNIGASVEVRDKVVVSTSIVVSKVVLSINSVTKSVSFFRSSVEVGIVVVWATVVGNVSCLVEASDSVVVNENVDVSIFVDGNQVEGFVVVGKRVEGLVAESLTVKSVLVVSSVIDRSSEVVEVICSAKDKSIGPCVVSVCPKDVVLFNKSSSSCSAFKSSSSMGITSRILLFSSLSFTG